MNTGSLILALITLTSGASESRAKPQRPDEGVTFPRVTYLGVSLEAVGCIPAFFGGDREFKLAKVDTPSVIRQGMLWVVENKCPFDQRITIRTKEKTVNGVTSSFTVSELFDCTGEDSMVIDRFHSFVRFERRIVFCALNGSATSQGTYTFCVLNGTAAACPAKADKNDPLTYEIEIQVLP